MYLDNIPCVELDFTDPGHVNEQYCLDEIIYDIDCQIQMLSSKADSLDYLMSIASGVLCASLDVLWVGDFNLQRGKDFSQNQVNKFVVKMAQISGYEGDDLQKAVAFLEHKFPIAADKCTADFGGGLQHHLRDFSHHPTLVGLACSLLTQFTGLCYGTDTSGVFKVVPVPEAGKIFIGKDIPSKIINGTIIWFFHLVSDMAGSSGTVLKSGGTGIPGPILGLAKEISALPIFKDQGAVSLFLSKLFNGTLLAEHDADGKIIRDTVLRFDLRAELGVAVELGRQALPIIANDCIVRLFYFIRRFTAELKDKKTSSIGQLRNINWKMVKPSNNPTIDRMLLVATGVFTTIDIADAAVSEDFLLRVNYVGIGRFAIAVGKDVSWSLKRRQLYKVKQMYQTIEYYTFRSKNFEFYQKANRNSSEDAFEVTVEQARILYNLEYYKTLNDMEKTETALNKEAIKSLKREWLQEWKEFITNGFTSFIQGDDSAKMIWYEKADLFEKISENHPEGQWFRASLLELMLFDPYYALSVEKDKKGKLIPSTKYKDLQGMVGGYKKDLGDTFIEECFHGQAYYKDGYVKRLRKSYDKISAELNKVIQTVIKTVAITAAASTATMLLAAAFAPSIAVALVGSQFAGLHGVALVNASMAFLGGGALAAGGAGMAGGTAAIIGGGAVLGIGIGAGASGTAEFISYGGKKNTVLQYSKLITILKEVILNDEHDYCAANLIYERVVQILVDAEKELVELEIRLDDLYSPEKEKAEDKLKQMNDTVSVMKIARRCIKKDIDSRAKEQQEAAKLMLTGEEKIQLLLPEPTNRHLLLNGEN